MPKVFQNISTAVGLFVVVSGVVFMFAAEVWPGFFFFAPPAAIGILRAYIIIHGPDIRDRIGGDDGYVFEKNWMWGSTVLVGLYILALYARDKIDLDMMVSLEVANVLLVGAEMYYSHLKGGAPDKVREMSETIHKLREDVGTLSENLREKSDTIAEMSENLREKSENIGQMSETIDVNSDTIRKTLAKVGKMSEVVRIGKYNFRFCPNCATPNRWTSGKASHSCTKCGRELCE